MQLALERTLTQLRAEFRKHRVAPGGVSTDELKLGAPRLLQNLESLVMVRDFRVRSFAAQTAAHLILQESRENAALTALISDAGFSAGNVLTRLERGNRKTADAVCDLLVSLLHEDGGTYVLDTLTVGLISRHHRISTLKEISRREGLREETRDCAAALLRKLACAECGKEARESGKALCSGCAGLDSLTKLILEELSASR